jgi:hypothetical protein
MEISCEVDVRDGVASRPWNGPTTADETARHLRIGMRRGPGTVLMTGEK